MGHFKITRIPIHNFIAWWRRSLSGCGNAINVIAGNSALPTTFGLEEKNDVPLYSRWNQLWETWNIDKVRWKQADFLNPLVQWVD